MEKRKEKKKLITSGLIGRQLSRLRMGQSYYAIIVSTITMIAMLRLAFNIEFVYMILLFSIFIGSALLLGYYLDKKNINSMEYIDLVNRQNRFINLANIKNQQFEIVKTNAMIDTINKMTNLFLESIGKEITDFDDIKERFAEEYQKYYKKWKPPKI